MLSQVDNTTVKDTVDNLGNWFSAKSFISFWIVSKAHVRRYKSTHIYAESWFHVKAWSFNAVSNISQTCLQPRQCENIWVKAGEATCMKSTQHVRQTHFHNNISAFPAFNIAHLPLWNTSVDAKIWQARALGKGCFWQVDESLRRWKPSTLTADSLTQVASPAKLVTCVNVLVLRLSVNVMQQKKNKKLHH